jgi:phosphoribosylamine--glycine ligase
VFVAPGNAGTALEPNVQNLPISAEDIAALAEFADKKRIGLTIVGPEVPLVAGVTDYFSSAGLPCFGPTAAAARLEGSKAFAKDFLARHGIPTAAYQNFTELAPAIEYIRSQGAPIVVKADGLAAGKGVVVARTVEEAEAAARSMLADRSFGEAGGRIVVEECLAGEEASFIVMVAGQQVLPLASSQDHKARDEGDRGPNTGGMGAYSPAPVITPSAHRRVMEEVIKPTVAGLAEDGMRYTGFLYAGLMVAPDGTPRVLEFNCRFGDPETQPIMMRLNTDLPSLCEAALAGNLDESSVEWDPRAAVGVVMAAGGYPGKYEQGQPISGLPALDDPRGKVFHAGTREVDGVIETAGGRVLCVVALGDTVTAAQRQAYELVNEIEWKDAYWRPDIGYRAIQREAE